MPFFPPARLVPTWKSRICLDPSFGSVHQILFGQLLWPKQTVAQFIYFVAISGIVVNYVIFNSIVLNSVLNLTVNDMSVLAAK